MSKIVEYSSKSTAVRGIERAGIAKADADKHLFKTADGKWAFDQDAVTEALAAAQRGTEVVEGADKSEAVAAAAVTSASALEQMTQDEIDADLAAMCGYSHCPKCGIHLSNGVLHFDSLEDQHGPKKAYELQKHEWSCMGCNAEWGKEIEAPKSKGRKEPTSHYTNKSSVDGAVARCHELYNANPEARRKDAIQLAVDAGIAFYTARTQYQKWFQARKTGKVK